MAAAPHPSGLPGSVLLAGGGTAGHVSPLLALAEHLREERPDIRIRVLGTAEGLESRLVPERGYELATIPKVPMPRRPSADLLRLPGNLRRAVARAGQIIEDSHAEVVVGFGGYVSTPVYLAARRRGVPIAIHEQNARAGIAPAVMSILTVETDLAARSLIRVPLRGPALVRPLRAIWSDRIGSSAAAFLEIAHEMR